MDLTPELLVSLTGFSLVGVAALVLTIPPLWTARRAKLTHVRQVWAHAEPIRSEAEPGYSRSLLVVTNGGAWPVWNVMIVHPEPVAGHIDFTSVGPYCHRTHPAPASAASSTALLTMYVTDHRGKLWLWSPEAQTITPIPLPIHRLARLVQFLVRHSPGTAAGRALTRLPDGLLVFLWGYHPEGRREGDIDPFEDHLRRVRDKLRETNRLAE